MNHALDRIKRLDEIIHSCEGWKVGDAAFCQITLNTFFR